MNSRAAVREASQQCFGMAISQWDEFARMRAERNRCGCARGWQARLELAYARRGAASYLSRRKHTGPLVVQKALYPEGEAVFHGIVLHPPAGIASGDELGLSVGVGMGAHVLLTTPGAGKGYRSAGASARRQLASAWRRRDPAVG